MKFTVKDKETGKIVSPRNYYFVIKQNGELYTFNGAGNFVKADDKYEIISERQTPIEPNNNIEAKQLIIGDVSGSAFLTNLLSEIKQHEREIISDPHRFTGISTAELERVFDKHGVKMKIPF